MHILRIPNYQRALLLTQHIFDANWYCTWNKKQSDCHQYNHRQCKLGISHPQPVLLFISTQSSISYAFPSQNIAFLADLAYNLRIFPPMGEFDTQATMGHFLELAYMSELFQAIWWAKLMISRLIWHYRLVNEVWITGEDHPMCILCYMLYIVNPLILISISHN
jgi:hypothetical protein